MAQVCDLVFIFIFKNFDFFSQICHQFIIGTRACFVGDSNFLFWRGGLCFLLFGFLFSQIAMLSLNMPTWI